MMTPEQVRERVAAMAPLVEHDPDRFHGDRDQLHVDVLRAIRDQPADAAALAEAALTTADISPLWDACA
jgi:hypothetical protein